MIYNIHKFTNDRTKHIINQHRYRISLHETQLYIFQIHTAHHIEFFECIYKYMSDAFQAEFQQRPHISDLISNGRIVPIMFLLHFECLPHPNDVHGMCNLESNAYGKEQHDKD